MLPKEKRAACVGKRPKSREETPKEGSDNAKALPHRNNMRPRCTKRKSFRNISGAKIRNLRDRQKARAVAFSVTNFSHLTAKPPLDQHRRKRLIPKLSNS